MEKIYRSLKWLKMRQAVEYLEMLTGSQLSADVLIQFSVERKLDIYINMGLPGIEGTLSATKEIITLYGLQQVRNPDTAFLDQDDTCAVLQHGNDLWIGLLPRNCRAALIKTSDIETLAATINAASAAPCAELVEGLQQQLEYERISREAAERRVTQLEKNKPSHSLMIGVLLELLKKPVVKPRVNGQNQAAIKAEVMSSFGNIHGLGERNIDGIFSDSNRAFKEAISNSTTTVS
ncbi:hypothetical protein ACET5Z_12880 [Aeromonas veronii]